MSKGKSTVINGKVYYGGGWTDNDNRYVVYCYDPPQDNWTTLPPLPVRRFGLGQVSGKLVAVGGLKKSDNRPTNTIYTYDERSKKWKQTIPPMPTARYATDVFNIKSSAFVVASGDTIDNEVVNAVEIFKPDTSQWYRTDSLPSACCDVSTAVIGNTGYILGGFKQPFCLNQALYASVDDLLHNAVPANQTTHSGSSADTQSAWRTLPNTPTYRPTAAVLGGNLLVIGGTEMAKTAEGAKNVKQEVYTYSPSTNSWIYFSDLPEPRSVTAVAVLSSAEILVIGGWNDEVVNTLYKGTLTFVA